MDSRQDIEQRVVRTLTDVLALREPPPLEANIAVDLQASSMDVVTLVVALEEEFGRSVPADLDLAALVTVEDVVVLVARHLGSVEPPAG